MLGPVVAADVGVVLGHSLTRMAQYSDQIFEAATVQTPVAGEAVSQAVEADDMGPATRCGPFKPRRVQHPMQGLAEHAIALVSGPPGSIHE